MATPIGNLADITFRAVDVLRGADLVLAEDTRSTGHLLAHHGIDARMRSLHQHNEAAMAGEVTAHLREGRDVALVSEAGTPAVSDPGALLVAAVRAAGFDCVPVPGPSAAVAALSVSGMPGPFAFVGFLPPRQSARRATLGRWREFPHNLIFYEAPHRILETARDLEAVLGASRRVLIARELTKLFEQIHACALGEAAAWLEADPNRTRGEFVLVVEGAPAGTAELTAQDEHLLAALLAELPVRQAVDLAAQIAGGKRKAFYRRALELSPASG